MHMHVVAPHLRKLLAGPLFLCTAGLAAQLPNGSTAPDFTLTDYYGTTHNLYSYLDAGKTVLLKIFAAHCPSCWAYHQTHRLANLHEQYGPDGTNELMVLALEHDQWNGHNEFIGIGPPWVTAGDWLTGTPFPIFDVEDPHRGVFADYNVTSYPVVYKICPDRILQRVHTSQTEAQIYQQVQACQAEVSVAELSETGTIHFDPRIRSLYIEQHEQVQGLEIFDMQGRVVQRMDAITSSTVQVAEMPAGVYLFRLRTVEGVVVKRFLVE
ncbi:MAG: T9SS type A sorting domain-containing protein [Flavobacteriales bacterium]